MHIAEEILKEISELFKEKLQDKNSWGKNDVFNLYQQCEIEVLRKYV